jgi:hypothetical protein
MNCLGREDAHPNFTLYHALGNPWACQRRPGLAAAFDETEIASGMIQSSGRCSRFGYWHRRMVLKGPIGLPQRASAHQTRLPPSPRHRGRPEGVGASGGLGENASVTQAFQLDARFSAANSGVLCPLSAT